VLAPTDIKADRPNRRFEVSWPDGRTDRIAFRLMRCDCPCAACVSELTGERLLDPTSVPQDVEPAAVELAGNYALKVRWSDRHETGLFTWDHLRRLGNSVGPV
jgi:DUF971 family protein